MKIKPLGEVKKTERGFEIIEFTDYYGHKCSLQQSSLAIYEQPGSSAIWLGCEEPRNHSVTGEPLAPRMHLTLEQVQALIENLKAWVKTGTFDPYRAAF